MVNKNELVVIIFEPFISAPPLSTDFTTNIDPKINPAPPIN
jgi:hypothetical protein